MTFFEFVGNIILMIIGAIILLTFVHIIVGKNPKNYWKDYKAKRFTFFQSLVLFYFDPWYEGRVRRHFKMKGSDQVKGTERVIVFTWVMVILILIVVIFLRLKN